MLFMWLYYRSVDYIYFKFP